MLNANMLQNNILAAVFIIIIVIFDFLILGVYVNLRNCAALLGHKRAQWLHVW